MMFEVPEPATIKLDYVVSNPAPSKVHDELTEVTYYLMANKKIGLKLEGTYEDISELHKAVQAKIKLGLKAIIENREFKKSNSFSEPKLTALQKAPYLDLDEREMGVIEFKPYASKSFANEENRFKKNVHVATLALSALSVNTTCFTPSLSYPIIKSRARTLPKYPRYIDIDGNIVMLVNQEMLNLVKKYVPTAECTRDWNEIKGMFAAKELETMAELQKDSWD